MKTFYMPEMVAQTDSYSKSPSKPRLFVEALVDAGLNPDIQAFDPVTREDFYLAHDPDHVDAILDLKKNNGFGNRSQAVADSLAYTTGSMVAAARDALQTGGQARACSPTSGFHHAGFDYSEGFCTFNGLMVTAIKLHREFGIRVAIIDCDYHYGDGTQHIIHKLGIDYVDHYTSGERFGEETNSSRQQFFKWLEQAVDSANASCDLILYQAGQDMATDDPLGGLLPPSYLPLRDEQIHAAQIPVAWNLAGGYCSPYQTTIDRHIQTYNTFAAELQQSAKH